MATASSGFITILTTALTVMAGPATGPGTFILQANPANSGTYCYVGNNGSDTVTTITGFSLSKTIGNQLRVTVGPGGLAELYFLSDTENDDIMYIKVAGEGDNVAAY